MPFSIHRMTALLQFELVRMFLTKRGLVGLATFLLVWLLLLRYPIHGAVGLLQQQDVANMLVMLTGSAGVKKLIAWPESELAIYWVMSLYVFPMFVVGTASDQTVEDRMRGTLRFITLRATRFEVLAGRFFGQLTILYILIALTLCATLVMLGIREPALLPDAMARSATMSVVLLITCAPFVALMALLNCTARSARMAVVQAILLFTLGELVLAFISWKFPALQNIKYLLPGVQVNAVAVQNAGSGIALIWPIVHSMLILALAQFILKRKSL